MKAGPGALILAGGGSRRMGRDKAWLALDGQPLLARIAGVLAPRCAPIVVSAAPGQRLPMSADIELLRVDDPQVDAGPLVGAVAGLERLAAAGAAQAYLSSCDAAALAGVHVDFMLAALAARADAPALIPVDAEGRRHPLAAAVRVEPILARGRALLAAGEARLQSLLAEAATIGVDALPEPLVLAPCNTEAQWRALSDALALRTRAR
ncbi:NTP transferase domain-containing protein [Pseudenhygromyxa sp. WMMC2535]|uniref:NTP transferase domain-containing protein n=1 Tax=Pseudenhygromyxa sp. WMMC2535 TaxID=2712867 RepID=UPI001553AD4B|nr:NTP transferase domain-containing protein [Pseudenhygromyxa sp. WMMC2535]